MDVCLRAFWKDGGVLGLMADARWSPRFDAGRYWPLRRVGAVFWIADGLRLSVEEPLLQIGGVILDEEWPAQRAQTALGSSALTDGTDKPRWRRVPNGTGELSSLSALTQLVEAGRVFRNSFISATFREEQQQQQQRLWKKARRAPSLLNLIGVAEWAGVS